MVLKAVFFDMDDTLVLTSEVDVKASIEAANLACSSYPQVNREALLARWHSEFTAAPWDTTHQVPVPVWRARHWEAGLKEQGVQDAELAGRMQQHFDKARIVLFQFEPGVKEMIAKMRADGIHTVIITNGHAEIQQTKLRACKAVELFDGILVGGEEVLAGRHEKPHPSIFLAACRLSKCQPADAVHIGDNLVTDIMGGNKAGLKATIWVDRQGKGFSAVAWKPECRPSHIVQHVTDLAKLMPELNT